jgi:hypothetical protein
MKTMKLVLALAIAVCVTSLASAEEGKKDAAKAPKVTTYTINMTGVT